MPKFLKFFLRQRLPLRARYVIIDTYMTNLRKNFIAAAAVFCGLALLVPLALPAASHAAGSGETLVLPASREQYLELEAPSWAAFSDEHLAIVDGSTLYLFDRGTQSYKEVALERDVTQIGFSGDRLFLSDRDAGTLGFYEYDYGSGSLNKIPDVNCSTFCIDGDILYTATVGGDRTAIGKFSISALGAHNYAENLGTVPRHVTPSMTVSGGTLYCAFNEAVYFVDGGQIDNENPFWLSQNPSSAEDVRAVCALGGEFYYTSHGERGGLYRRGQDVPILEDNTLGYLFSYGEKLYVVAGRAVREIALNEEGATFTDYEISSASASKNRLSGAVDTAMADGTVVWADSGNRRVTVRREDGTYDNLPVAGTPTLVSTDGSLIAAAAGNRIFYGTNSLETYLETAEPVRGIACVYGYLYYVTETAYGCLAPDSEAPAEVFHSGHGSPAALTADAYGDLFVAMSDRRVFRFSEQEFTLESGEGTVVCTLPEGYSSLRADSEGDLLYLVGDDLFLHGTSAPILTLGHDYVHTKEAGSPLAFALGFETDSAYFLFGNYAVRADGLPVSTLKTIPAEDSFREISRPHTADGVRKVTVSKSEIGIMADLSVLEDGSEYFEYAGRDRIRQTAEGIVLAETETHRVVALYENNRSCVYLFRLDGAKPLSPLPHEEKTGTMFVTNEVYLYHFPALLYDGAADVPTHAPEPLARGTRVELVEQVEAPERGYAYVRTGGAEGYLPLSYLSETDPDGGVDRDFLWGKLKKDIEFSNEEGSVTLAAGTEVRLTEDADGYFARYTDETGRVYTAHVARGDIDRGENDALRIALIVILSVLALLIIGVYIYLLPRKPKE